MTIKQLSLLTLAALAGCGSDDAAVSKRNQGDPLFAAALSQPLMVDPDLAALNNADSAIVPGGPPQVILPDIDTSAEEIEAARAAAARLTGSRIEPLPLPASAGEAESAPDTLAELAASTARRQPGCSGPLAWSMSYAAMLPAELALFPRAHLRQAIGADSPACRLRAASFVSPVDQAEVAAFYHQRLGKAGWQASHAQAGEVIVLRGSKGLASYVIHLRKLENGASQVDLAASGL